ncbi:hypothetical protein L914_00565 [Phytophthora nicotianae]|uniref:RxLR effector PexRD54 WY domain-containing protein n=1 Tax=Phytophthora nicotianae TaxID=4792 RepID=W2P6N6_PHYNI|nr:hypothetical protein L914_00565 [Phytophthora nicotianae]
MFNRVSIDDIFTRLSLNTAGNKIFEDPNLMTWAVFVTKVEKKNPEDIILAKLNSQYAPESLASMIEAAKKVSSTERFASVLQAQQRQVWFSTGESGDDIFKLLKLDETGTKLFESPQVTTWASYVDEFNKNAPNKKVSMLTLLARRYEEEDLVKMIEAAKKVPSTEDIAVKLQAELKASVGGGKSPENFFKMLKLDDTGEELFKSPAFPTWVSYVDHFNRKNSGEASSIFARLTKIYGEVKLAEMIETAIKTSTAETIAKRLQEQQNLQWLSKQKSPDDVFKLLKLDKLNSAVLSDVKLSAWLSYVKDFNLANPRKEESLLKTLTHQYKEVGAAKIIQQGKELSETKNLAEDLQVAQFTRWFRKGVSDDNIHKLLNVKTLDDPNMAIVDEYIKFYMEMMKTF